MSDVQIIIEVVGEQDMLRATKTAEKFRKEYGQLDSAFNKGKINAQQYAKGIQQVDSRLQQQVSATNRSASALAKEDVATKRATQSKVRYAAAAQSATGATNRTRQAFLNTANSIAILDGPLGGVASRFSSFGVLVGRTGIALAGFAVAMSALAVVVGKSISEFSSFEKEMNVIESRLKAVGNSVGFTSREIQNMSEQIAMSTLQSSRGIREASMQLLTFKSVAGETFTEVLNLASDMASLGFGTVQSESVKLAKALEDPRQSLTSLSRSGITFTIEQRRVIQSLQETGRAGEASAKILGVVRDQVGGAAQAEAAGFAGKIDTISQALSLLVRDLGEGVAGEGTLLDRLLGNVAERSAKYIESQTKPVEMMLDDLNENITTTIATMEELERRLNEGDFTSVRSRNATKRYYDELVERLRELRTEHEKLSSEQTTSTTDNLKLYTDEIEALSQLTEQRSKNTGLLEREINLQSELLRIGLFGDVPDTLKEIQAEAIAAINALFDTKKQEQFEAGMRRTLGSMQEQNEAARIALDYMGDTSAEAKALANQEVELNRLRRNGVEETDSLYQEMLNVTNEAVETARRADEVSAGIEDSADRANDLAAALQNAASAMSSLSGFTDGLDKALAVSLAKVDALRSGTNAAVAGRIAGMQVDLEARVNEAELAGADPLVVDWLRAGGQETIGQIEQAEAQRLALEESARSSRTSSSGRSAAAEKADFVEQLRKEMEQRRQLLSVFGEQRELMEEIFSIEKGLGDARSEYSDEAIQALARENILLQEREQAYEDAIALQQSLADTLENTMSDAFTSMVDGTKSFSDAVRDMARDVIKQLWDIFVVQQIVGSFDAASGQGSGIVGTIAGAFFADGAAFNKGKVTAYADGGVVSSPTLFPMANGAGLMGEAGPEAIMPLKRGKNGKLGVQTEGGGQTVVVHQSFNFSANGDESVKKIIMQSAPSIAQMTKKTILDDRRRGGTMKRTFG